ncbi:MAG: glycosyltransferase [Planctomycetes bacterium]|nr:glycosyltransferase [Planctomycetota bacterium]
MVGLPAGGGGRIMPAMTAVLHIFDRLSSPAQLQLLSELRRQRSGDVEARVGDEGGRGGLPAGDCTISQPWPWPLTAAAGIRRVLLRQRLDLIHCWSINLASAAAAVGWPTCVTVLHVPRRDQLARLRRATGEGAVVLASSDALARTLARRGLPANRIGVVAPAVAPGADDEKPGRAVRRGTDKCVLLAPAQHDDDRGPYWAVWALGILRQLGAEFDLLIPGAGPAVRRADWLARENGFGSSISFPGPLAGPEVWARADIAVLYEAGGFGLSAAAAAIAAGVPIIAAAAGELGEILTDGQTAVLAEPAAPRRLAEAIWRMHRNRQLAGAIANQAARTHKALLDVPGWLERMETFYRLLLGQSGGLPGDFHASGAVAGHPCSEYPPA